jgi:hypothetical protein
VFASFIRQPNYRWAPPRPHIQNWIHSDMSENGNVEPSEHDKVLTRAIVLASETVHLKVVDHLIVSTDETFSFRKAGLL